MNIPHVPLIVPPQSQAVLNGAVFQRSWYLFLQEVQRYASTAAGIVRYGRHFDRLSIDLGDLTDGTLWFETDRTVMYQFGASDLAWHYVGGIMFALLAKRPTDLSADDAGFLFWDTTPGLAYQWSGSAWASTGLVLYTSSGDVNANGYQVSGIQVVGAQKAAVSAPAGGGTAVSAPSGGIVQDVEARTAISAIITAVSSSGACVDTQARAAIVAILNVLSLAAGGHGLTA